ASGFRFRKIAPTPFCLELPAAGAEQPVTSPACEEQRYQHDQCNDFHATPSGLLPPASIEHRRAAHGSDEMREKGAAQRPPRRARMASIWSMMRFMRSATAR